MSDDNIRTVMDATCTFCGCVCDDINLTVDIAEHKITKSQNACVLGKAWFKEHGIEERPFALIGGREATTEEAVEEAAQDPRRGAIPRHLWPVGHHVRGAARGGVDRRHDRRQRRHHHLGVSRTDGHGVPEPG